jgi:hypothetical protein
VVRVPGYRSRGPGFDSRRYQIIWEVVGLVRGPLSLVTKIEELFGTNSSGSSLENLEDGRGDPLHWQRNTLYQQKLALTSPTSGGRSVCMVRLRPKATEFVYVYEYIYVYVCVYVCARARVYIYSSQIMTTGSFVILKIRGKFSFSIPPNIIIYIPYDIICWYTKQRQLSENSWILKIKNECSNPAQEIDFLIWSREFKTFFHMPN